ncbi:hypothetical protein SAMN05421647_103230 [Marinobacterium stanieri]|uniref:Uncharacterized protein n=1 Tax=Marinobacterium stanieri TaxID=49186 RepID=A0A1N6RBH3_9GAMM|nr:hypothetical protein SAMN05421647_103230 [Marinobacterium stanieri]
MSEVSQINNLHRAIYYFSTGFLGPMFNTS